MIYEHTNYRSYLRDQLSERIQHNRSYSLRAFARDIGLAPSTTTEILNGKRNLSAVKAFAVAQKLKLIEKEIEYFCLLVQFETMKQDEIRENIMNRMQLLRPESKPHDLSVDNFKMIADWHHTAILELACLDHFKLTPDSVAEKLGITATEAHAALERLERLELMERTKNGSYERAKGRILTSAPAPNSALRRFHTQMLEKATQSIETQTPKEKVIASETVAFDPAQLEKIRKLSDEFLNNILKIASQGKNKTQVYHMGLQFFNLTNNENKTKVN